MDKYQIIYEYIYTCESGYMFKKQICINDNKKIIFNFIVNGHFNDEILLTSFNNDFKDNILNNKIKEYLLKQIKDLVDIKTLFLTIRNKGNKPNIEILKNGIKFDNKVFRLKDNDYHSLQYKLLDYIDEIKKNKVISK